MKLIEMTIKNVDGKNITKKIEDRLVPYYKSLGWTIKIKPKKVTYGIGIEEHDKEGRVITLEFDDFYMVDIYTPNSKRELERLDYRMIWEDEFRNYLLNLKD